MIKIASAIVFLATAVLNFMSFALYAEHSDVGSAVLHLIGGLIFMCAASIYFYLGVYERRESKGGSNDA